MPDIKTALSTALTEWEQDDKQQENQMKHIPHFKVTNNVTRATFDYVKNNPRQSCKEICAALEKDGYKSSSIGSLLTQFVKNGLCVRDATNNYSVLVNEYSPIKIRRQVKAKQVIAKAKATRGEGIAALGAQPMVKTAWDVETVINNIGLKQAHALYVELHTYFGG
jgi:hypothetical protein